MTNGTAADPHRSADNHSLELAAFGDSHPVPFRARSPARFGLLLGNASTICHGGRSMRRVVSDTLLVVGGLLLFSTMSSAQGTSTGTIAGSAKDTSGAVLPGVTVEASSPALIEKSRTTVTDERGEYKIIE